MKKKLLLILTIVLCSLPLVVNAKKYYDGYKTMNLVDTLKAEGMEIKNKNYKETDNQAVIYMFRGQTCSFCRKFLTFINSISDEYGKYFKLVSFEVWNDANNSALFSKMSNVTGVPTDGVPYIIIGSKVFGGYSSTYDSQIKEAIMNEYKNKSTDIFDKLAAYDDGSLNPEVDGNTNDGDTYNNTSSTTGNDTFAIIFWNLIFIAAATGVIIYFQTKNRNDILEKINEIKEEKKDMKKKKLGD